jgi:hypothetical protein
VKRLSEAAASSARELVFLAGLVLLSAGAGQVYAPAALIVPGAILVWLAIPAAPQQARGRHE